MTIRASAITPSVLVWARLRAGLTVTQVGERIGKEAEVIESWEAGESAPTYKQLEVLAEKVYHRPVALFFFPEPPEERDAGQEFRTLPDFEIDALSADSRYAVRTARAYQRSLDELTGGRNPAGRLIHRDLRSSLSANVEELSAHVREYLGVSMAAQEGWKDSRVAMNAWRDAIERVGVFVFKRSFEQREVSGFCLIDDEFPVIMVNNSTPFTRQIFTLVHELAHLIFGVSSITKAGDIAAALTGDPRAIEIACNRLAAEILVPVSSFPWQSVDRERIGEVLEELAGRFCVSREVILRRLKDSGVVDSRGYEEYLKAFDYDADQGRSGAGGNYYRTQVAYLGNAFLGLAFSRYHAGLISVSELAEHLGVRAKNIDKLEGYVSVEA